MTSGSMSMARTAATALRDGRRSQTPAPPPVPIEIPRDRDRVRLQIGSVVVTLTNLRKTFWPDEGITKGDLLRYYAEVAPWLLQHVRDRPMVLRRYPDGIDGESFFMKRAPSHRPEWLERCSVTHGSGRRIAYVMVQNLPSLLWVVNLGSIDLHPWYATCDDVHRPDVLNFDLDPVAGTPFARVREAALLVRDALDELGAPAVAKTTGSRGIHVAVPIRHGPTQKQVWAVARRFGAACCGDRRPYGQQAASGARGDAAEVDPGIGQSELGARGQDRRAASQPRPGARSRRAQQDEQVGAGRGDSPRAVGER